MRLPVFDPSDPRVAREITRTILERFYVRERRAVAFHDLRIEQYMDVATNMMLDLSAYVWAQKLQDEQVALSVSYPSTWWQHFKQRWFPKWALAKWPVRKTEVTRTHRFKTLALLPEFKYEAPRDCGEAVIMSYVSS